MESEFGSQGNPQRDSAFNGRALAACECEDTGEPEALGIADRAQTPAGKNYRHRE
jgi:hypothetical protein